MSSFKIAVPDQDIALLKRKLQLTRLPDELDEAGWDYGCPLSDIRRLVTRWRDEYDWRKHEKALNDELPQFTRDIEVEGHGTLNVHYVHQKSKIENAVPLLFVHGWPGSFIEVRKVLPLLVSSQPGSPSFHVVALGLPGYGFSEAPKKKGFNPIVCAEVGHKLMLALGYNEYVTQGGDWGYLITRHIAVKYGGKHVKAWHTNVPGTNPPPNVDPTKLTPQQQADLERSKWLADKGSGYFLEQSTQPQTIGYSLADSPVGLLAWIYEKLVSWTDDYPWDDDEVLTWISIYWFSRSGPAASVRIYYETAQAGGLAKLLDAPTNIPLGLSYFPKEISNCPKEWFTDKDIVFVNRNDRGGHFAAYENPEALVGDVRKMFGKGGPVYGVVSGKDGYA